MLSPVVTSKLPRFREKVSVNSDMHRRLSPLQVLSSELEEARGSAERLNCQLLEEGSKQVRRAPLRSSHAIQLVLPKNLRFECFLLSNKSWWRLSASSRSSWRRFGRRILSFKRSNRRSKDRKMSTRNCVMSVTDWRKRPRTSRSVHVWIRVVGDNRLSFK